MASKWPSSVPVVRYAGDDVAITNINLASFDTVCVYECEYCEDGDIGLIFFRELDNVEPLNKSARDMLAIAKAAEK